MFLEQRSLGYAPGASYNGSKCRVLVFRIRRGGRIDHDGDRTVQ